MRSKESASRKLSDGPHSLQRHGSDLMSREASFRNAGFRAPFSLRSISRFRKRTSKSRLSPPTARRSQNRKVLSSPLSLTPAVRTFDFDRGPLDDPSLSPSPPPPSRQSKLQALSSLITLYQLLSNPLHPPPPSAFPRKIKGRLDKLIEASQTLERSNKTKMNQIHTLIQELKDAAWGHNERGDASNAAFRELLTRNTAGGTVSGAGGVPQEREQPGGSRGTAPAARRSWHRHAHRGKQVARGLFQSDGRDVERWPRTRRT